jgi:hypothetical protein
MAQENGARRRATGIRQATQESLTILAATPVILATVAGGEQQGGPAGLSLFSQESNRFGPAKRQTLALLYCGRMMAYPNHME